MTDDPDTDSVEITGFDDTAVLVDTAVMFGSSLVDHVHPLDALDVDEEDVVEQLSEDTLTRQLADLDNAAIEDVSDTDRMPVPCIGMSRAGTEPEWPPEPPPPQIRPRRHKGVYAVARPKTSNESS